MMSFWCLHCFEQLQSNFIEIALRHGCPPVNLLHVFRTLFLKNTSEWLLLNYVVNVTGMKNKTLRENK